jgi:hypothetical protein
MISMYSVSVEPVMQIWIKPGVGTRIQLFYFLTRPLGRASEVLGESLQLPRENTQLSKT